MARPHIKGVGMSIVPITAERQYFYAHRWYLSSLVRRPVICPGLQDLIGKSLLQFSKREILK